MKISLEWLNDYIRTDLEPARVADMLTAAGLEVEGIDYQTINLKDVVAARVGSIRKHPDSDKLFICTAQTDKGECTIVCGDNSIREGDIVPLALPGSRQADGRVISETKVRGVVSAGMFCSEKELGVSEDGAAVMILPDNIKPGIAMEEVLLQLDPGVNVKADGGVKKEGRSFCDNAIFEVGLTPNRSDCLSLFGFARELAALTGGEPRFPDVSIKASDKKCNDEITVHIKEPQLCTRYSARIIKGVRIGKSPLWLRKRLEGAGVRPINSIVDVTNYVMLELGQPLHAFDLSRVKGGKIIVRKAEKEEKLVTLDEVERTLNEGELVISDSERALALAGVMGGLESSVNEGTADILLESAHFNPSAVRKSVRKTGLHSESSHRFERGTDVEGVVKALDRAAKLIGQLAGGEIWGGAIDNYPQPCEKKRIAFRPDRCSKLLGVDIPVDESLGYLKALHMEVISEGDAYVVIPPSYRVDIEREIDLVEEVARLKGYDLIPVEPLAGSVPEREAEDWSRSVYSIKRFMADCGFNEAKNYAFEGPKEIDRLGLSQEDPLRRRVKLLNPISEDLSVMKSTLISGLLGRVAYNIKKQNRELQLFEAGKVFESNGGDVKEDFRLTALITGSKDPLLWRGEKDVYHLKGVLENLLDLLNVKEYTFENCSDISYLHPGKGARAYVADEPVGILGEIHPDICSAYDILQKVFLFDVDLKQILSVSSAGKIGFSDIAAYPYVERDMALLVDEAVTLKDILVSIKALEKGVVEKVEVFDQYEGKGIEEGKKSLGIRIRYRSLEGTLTDEEVNALQQSILSSVIKQVGAAVR